MNRVLYQRRLEQHLSGAKTHRTNKDYVQAGEKVWGALSALVNTKSNHELKSQLDKKPLFSGLVNKLRATDSTIRLEMNQLELRDGDEVFLAIYDLHRMFYGGTDYSEAQVLPKIDLFIKVIEKLKSS